MADKTSGQTPIIFLDNISVTFKSRTGSLFHPNLVHAVNGLTLKLMPGETIGIVGESGCGKSTTANVMCGLQSPTDGRVYFKGDDVTKRTAELRKKIGRVVGIVGLPSSAMYALPGQLSGGQRQRVAIARALSLQPDVIIADEPTSALDVSVRAQILNLLTDLKKELGLAMVFISHDIQTERYISDRIVVMNHGQIMEEGPARQIFEDPHDAYTKTLLGAAPSLLHPNLGQ